MALDNGDARRRYLGFNDLILARDEKPDIIALQEVAWRPGEASLSALCIKLGSEYKLEVCPVYAGVEDKKGSAIISRHPMTDHRKLDLPAGGKSVQLATIETPEGPQLQIANVHMEASPLKEVTRVKKLTQIIEFLSQNPEFAHLIVGDFNAERFFPSVRRVKKLGMSSVFDTLGAKSSPTYPTPLSSKELVGHGYSKPHQLHIMRALGQFITGDFSDDSGLRKSVVDYIFHNNLVQPISADVLPETHGGELLSDHRFLAASLLIGHREHSTGCDRENYDELPELDTAALST